MEFRNSFSRDVKVSRPAWSRGHFFGLGLGLGLTVIGFGLGLDLIGTWSRVSYVLSRGLKAIICFLN